MKRLAWTGAKIGSVVVVMVLTGCVSRGKYDELKFAQNNCEAERQRLAAELAGAQNTILAKDEEIKRLKDLLNNREEAIKGLKDQLAATQKYLNEMKDIYGKLADRPIPTGGILPQPLPPRLSTALEELARKYPDMIEYDASRGVLKFKSDLLFDLGSDLVKPEVIPALQEFAKILQIPDAANFDAVVVGHTDNIPIRRAVTLAQHKTNWHLSVHRSISVMNVIKDAGVNPERIGVMGYGEYRPVEPNVGSRGNPKNRRVEIYVVPKQSIGDRSLRPMGNAPASPAAPSGEDLGGGRRGKTPRREIEY